MKLIVEEIQDVTVLTEGEGPAKKMYLIGPLLQAETINKNRRWYSAGLMEREVARYTKEKISDNRAWGELGHPQGPSINLDRVSHRVVSLERAGNDWNGKAMLINEGMGKIARALVESGGKLGMSSRGLGTLKQDEKRGCDIVQDDFHLAVAADIVADPSAPSAFVQGIMENANWVYDSAKQVWVQEAIADLRKDLRDAPAQVIEVNKVAIFEGFLKVVATTKTAPVVRESLFEAALKRRRD